MAVLYFRYRSENTALKYIKIVIDNNYISGAEKSRYEKITKSNVAKSIKNGCKAWDKCVPKNASSLEDSFNFLYFIYLLLCSGTQSLQYKNLPSHFSNLTKKSVTPLFPTRTTLLSIFCSFLGCALKKRSSLWSVGPSDAGSHIVWDFPPAKGIA